MEILEKIEILANIDMMTKIEIVANKTEISVKKIAKFWHTECRIEILAQT